MNVCLFVLWFYKIDQLVPNYLAIRNKDITLDMAVVDSPCIGICELDYDADICIGCFRTRAEVAGWGSASIKMKQEILERVHNRRSSKQEITGSE